MSSTVEIQIASKLRECFMKAFVDCARYEKMCGVHYLYDCLNAPKCYAVSFEQAKRRLQENETVYTIWDSTQPKIVSQSGIEIVPHYLELYQADTVIAWKGTEIAALLEKELGDYKTTNVFKNTLPEDLYVFDDTFSWCVIFTHSPSTPKEDARLCLLCRR